MDVTPTPDPQIPAGDDQPEQVDAVVSAAAQAATIYATWPRARRAELLDALADGLEAAQDELVATADTETHLGAPRLSGEVVRTSYQLRVFAQEVRAGDFLEAIIDRPAQTPMGPTPDLRRMLIPLGPVAVYAASNFPFAFSVLGGDTASALAAGNSVVVKAHPGHPRTSRAVAAIARRAVAALGAPEGLLGMVEGFDAGIALIEHPLITAAGFTGSLSGGRALADAAARRPAPIPFYGELGSLNPVYVTPGAAASRAEQLGTELAGSALLGGGQFCTKPGLLLIPAGEAGDAVVDHLAAAFESAGSLPALTAEMARSYADGVERRARHAAVRARGAAPESSAQTRPTLLEVSAAEADPLLLEECFGPLTVVARYGSEAEALAFIDRLEGSLTTTVLTALPDEHPASAVVTALAQTAGRIVFNGYPTGVAVNSAQHHGGPWPATNTVHTSVGVTAIRRFLRPIAWQDAPAAVLPSELRDGQVDVPRREDGVMVLPSGRPAP